MAASFNVEKHIVIDGRLRKRIGALVSISSKADGSKQKQIMNIPIDENELKRTMNTNNLNSNEIITTTQPNTNKSEYAFKESLNNLFIINIYLRIQEQPTISSMLHCSYNELIQSIHESDNQSGIVSNTLINHMNNTINVITKHEENINVHVNNDGRDNLNNFSHTIKMITNDSVNMICDLINYLINININRNLNINKKYSLTRINDQNVNDKKTRSLFVKQRDENEMQSYIKFDDLLKLIDKQRNLTKNPWRTNGMENLRLRLCGGGEDSLNSGTSAWGTLPTAANNPNGSWGAPNQQPPQGWGNSTQNPPQRPPPQQESNSNKSLQQQQQNSIQMPPGNNNNGSSWNPTANQNKTQLQPQLNTNNNQNVNINQQQPQQVPLNNAPGAVTAAAKMEHLNTMREALFSQDGWGCQHVNQDSNWEVPGSPEPGAIKPEPVGTNVVPPAPSVFKGNLNNGTELWEANLRNGGQPAQQTVQKTPWGPSNNIGGTWGEDDDIAEGGNAWTGGSTSNPPVSGQPAWNQNNKNVWNVGVIGTAGAPNLNNWDGGRSGPPPPNIGTQIPPGVIEANREIRGDPRGISGRLNGNSGMWDQHPMTNVPVNKMPPGPIPGTPVNANSQWPTGGSQAPNKIQSGWEDASPPAARPNMPNLDDGTALWGPNTVQRQNSNVANWKESLENLVRSSMPRNTMNIGNIPTGPTGPAARLNSGAPIKPENMWNQNPTVPGRNGSWDETNAPMWEDKGVNGGGNPPWNDVAQNTGWNKNKQGPVGGIWPDPVENINNDWTHGGINKPPAKLNPMDFIRNTKQYRILCDMGFKKEDVEFSLRNTNMSLDESLEILQRNSSTDWRRHEEHPVTFDQQFSGRYPTGPASSMPYPQNNQNVMNNMSGGGGVNPNMTAMNNLKYLSQAPPTTPSIPFNQPPGGLNQNSQVQPSTQQLRMLVQQIQMAVQTGFLNHQILNQPLAPQTLLLLNQLLNLIKQLQLTQTNLARSGGAGGSVNGVQMGMAISKLKTQIATLQSQIAQQQAIYVKQQGNTNATSHLGNDFIRNQNELSSLQGNFTEMAINKDQGVYQPSGSTSQQSRLNQWKLPTIDNKDGNHELTDFSRAPGTTAKSTLSTTSSAMGSLGLQSDGPWSSGRSNIADGWPEQANDPDNKDWAPNQDSSVFTDLVPEFEPGKPWKGTQVKVEDDPSITPGSIARSPLSISAAKDSDLFDTSNKASPTDPISLTSSTWSFNPGNTQQNSFTSTISKLGNNGKSTWSDNIAQPTTTTSELWGASMSKAPRGPPPGLPSNKSIPGGGAPGGNSSNGWIASNVQRTGPNSSWSNISGGGTPAWYSTWLLLKNLTAQIDGSTLRTLCMQHGPLQNFHMYLNHGIALCKYTSREEANKAQQALNNCLLGNTTICAESPTENEVQAILQQLGMPGGNGNGGNGSNSGNNNAGTPPTWRPAMQPPPRATGADTWGSAWSTSHSGANLWSPLDGASERGTPSTMNSFLPENLLGTELN